MQFHVRQSGRGAHVSTTLTTHCHSDDPKGRKNLRLRTAHRQLLRRSLMFEGIVREGIRTKRDYPCLFSRRLVLLFMTVALSLSPFVRAEEHQNEIFVESSLKQGSAILTEARLGDKRIEFTCSLSESGCRVFKKRTYLAFSTPPEEIVYQDCKNLTLFEVNARGKKGVRISVVCLLTK